MNKEPLLKKSLKEIFTPVRVVFLVFIILSYVFLFNHYMAQYIDDAWTLSWAYNYFEDGEVFDTVYGYLNGDGGTSLFSRTYVFIYGGFSKIFGWTRGGSYLLSTIFLFLSVICWGGILNKLKFDKKVIVDFMFIMVLLDPYFAIAHKTRVDSLALFFCSFAVLLFIHKRYFFSGLIMMIAFETHPLGIASLFYILGYLFYIRKDMRENPKDYIKGATIFILGMGIGICYYLLLHYKWIGNLNDLGSRAGGNAFVDYFFMKRFSWRHWPELVLIIFSAVIFFVKKLYKEYKILLPWLVASILTSLVLQRGNSHYVVYLLIPFILLLVLSFKHMKLTSFLLIGFLLFQIPQYGYLLYTQHDYNHGKFISELQDIVDEDRDLFIYGNFNGWFALMDYDYHCYGYFSRAGLDYRAIPDKFVIIEDPLFFTEDSYGKHFNSLVAKREEKGEFKYSVTEKTGISWFGGETVTVKLYSRQKK